MKDDVALISVCQFLSEAIIGAFKGPLAELELLLRWSVVEGPLLPHSSHWPVLSVDESLGSYSWMINVQLKSILEVSSAIAVLMGLAFVGFELRQNTAAVEASSRQSTTDAAVAWLLTIASDPELAHLWGIASNEPQNLSETKAIQLHLLQRSQWIRFQNAYLQWRNGTLSDDDWNIYEGFICRTQMRAQVNDNAASLRIATWDSHKAVLHSQFVGFVENCRGEPVIDVD